MLLWVLEWMLTMGENTASDQLTQVLIDRIETLDERNLMLIEMVHEIRENQIVIDGRLDSLEGRLDSLEGRLDSHIATTNSLSGSKTQSEGLLGIIWSTVKKYFIAAVLGLFLAFGSATSCSNKETTFHSDSATKVEKIDTIYFNRDDFAKTLKKSFEKKP